MTAPIPILGDLRQVNRRTEKLLNELGDAKGEVLKSGSVTLAKSLRKVLRATKGNPRAITFSKRRQAWGGTPSRPGEAPHEQSKRLGKSVAQGVSQTGRIVAVLAFYGGMLEEGVNATRGANKTAKSKGARGILGFRRKAGTVKRTLVIAPRPFMERAYNAVADEMAGIAVKVAGDVTERSLG